jgi:hypothetical protein
MRCRHSAWLHKFASTAEKALHAEFDYQGLTITNKISEFVKFLLGDPMDMLKKHWPFLWKSAYEAGDKDTQLAVCSAYSFVLFNLLTKYLGHISSVLGRVNIS